jgi:hypothetical protein
MNATPIPGANDIPELQAIVFASHVLKTFKDNEARLRVLRGVCQYFGLSVNVAGAGAPHTQSAPLDVAALQELVSTAAAGSQRFGATT